MAKRKPGRTKKTGNRKTKKTNRAVFRRIVGFTLLLIFVFIAGAWTHYAVMRKRAGQPAIVPDKTSRLRLNIPAFEIFPEKDPLPDKAPPPPAPQKLPRVAIIIDDLGHDPRLADQLMQLDGAVTLSILPFSPFRKTIYQKAKRKKIETMIHLPMEPMEYPHIDPGPGALLMRMSPDELLLTLEKNLDTMPSAKGVNNHMGSKMTTMSNQMYQIFSVLKKRGLFFVDSRTTAESLSRPSARLLQVPFAQRDIFLDHDQHADFIRKQLKKLVRIAIRHGEAIGIGHPHPLTIQVLREELPKLKNTVELVPASSVVHIVGA